jgi:hypothetical protein
MQVKFATKSASTRLCLGDPFASWALAAPYTHGFSEGIGQSPLCGGRL